MSQKLSRLYPLEVANHPQLEPEVKRAILASWASDMVAVPDHPQLRQPPGFDEPVDVFDVLAAMRLLDQPSDRSRLAGP